MIHITEYVPIYAQYHLQEETCKIMPASRDINISHVIQWEMFHKCVLHDGVIGGAFGYITRVTCTQVMCKTPDKKEYMLHTCKTAIKVLNVSQYIDDHKYIYMFYICKNTYVTIYNTVYVLQV